MMVFIQFGDVTGGFEAFPEHCISLILPGSYLRVFYGYSTGILWVFYGYFVLHRCYGFVTYLGCFVVMGGKYGVFSEFLLKNANMMSIRILWSVKAQSNLRTANNKSFYLIYKNVRFQMSLIYQ